MKRHSLFQFLTMLLFACIASNFLLAAETTNPTKPNILYILGDDLGYNDVGFNGCRDIKTPNLDKLAKEGTIFKSYYAQPLCSTSRASILTVRY
jgi:arylsulfatase A-like enzyme